jgi:DNA-binding NarL/FixJ family response regulator
VVGNNSDIRSTSKSVVLGHPDALICEGIAGILLKANYQVLGKANTEINLREQTSQYQPDIILFEPAICKHYADTISAFRQQVPKSVVALMSKRETFDGIAQAIEAGASGCISMDVSPEEFIKSLELLSAGGVVVSKGMANDVRRELTSKQEPKLIETLSGREREVLSHIGNGLSNRQIARKLFISENTVKVHVRGILNKLDLKNRQQAAVYASKERLIKPTEPENGKESTP